MFENIDLGAILEEKTRELVKGLLNFIEQLSNSLREARAEIQWFRAKPVVNPNNFRLRITSRQQNQADYLILDEVR